MLPIEKPMPDDVGLDDATPDTQDDQQSPELEAIDEIRSLCDQIEMGLAKKRGKPNEPPTETPAVTEEEI